MNDSFVNLSRKRITFGVYHCIACGHRKPPYEFRKIYRSKNLPRTCATCRQEYDDLDKHILSGNKRRFIAKVEIPRLSVQELDLLPRYASRRFRDIFKILTWLRERRLQKQKEVRWMPDELAKKMIKLPDTVAKILAKTYAVCGDDFKLDDYMAIEQIRDLLLEIDPKIIDRNKPKSKRLSS